LDEFAGLLLGQAQDVVGAPAKIGIVKVFVGLLARGRDFILEYGHLLLELSRVSAGLDDTLLKSSDVVVNGRSVIAA
jgi:hypothetical protein